MCSNEKVIVVECVIALCERNERKMFADVRRNDGWLDDGHDFVVSFDVSVHVLRRCPSVVSPRMLEVVDVSAWRRVRENQDDRPVSRSDIFVRDLGILEESLRYVRDIRDDKCQGVHAKKNIARRRQRDFRFWERDR